MQAKIINVILRLSRLLGLNLICTFILYRLIIRQMKIIVNNQPHLAIYPYIYISRIEFHLFLALK